MKITAKQLNNENLVKGLNKLLQHDFHLKIGYHIGKVSDKVDQAIKAAREEWIKILKTKVEWNEEKNEAGEMIKTTPKDKEQVNKLEKEFLEVEFDLEKNPIHVHDIASAKLSPLEIMALEPILTGIETLTEGE